MLPMAWLHPLAPWDLAGASSMRPLAVHTSFAASPRGGIFGIVLNPGQGAPEKTYSKFISKHFQRLGKGTSSWQIHWPDEILEGLLQAINLTINCPLLDEEFFKLLERCKINAHVAQTSHNITYLSIYDYIYIYICTYT